MTTTTAEVNQHLVSRSATTTSAVVVSKSHEDVAVGPIEVAIVAQHAVTLVDTLVVRLRTVDMGVDVVVDTQTRKPLVQRRLLRYACLISRSLTLRFISPLRVRYILT
jgi:hypothetical protein